MTKKRPVLHCYTIRRESGAYPKLVVNFFPAVKRSVQEKIDGAADDYPSNQDMADEMRRVYSSILAEGWSSYYADPESSERGSVYVSWQESPRSDYRDVAGYCRPDVGLPERDLQNLENAYSLLQKVLQKTLVRTKDLPRAPHNREAIIRDPATLIAALDLLRFVRVRSWEGRGSQQLSSILVLDTAPRRRRMLTENWLALFEGSGLRLR